jgi:EAL domain-containing protein (putative c-di-GMP-specific phosphodiesterase class I)
LVLALDFKDRARPPPSQAPIFVTANPLLQIRTTDFTPAADTEKPVARNPHIDRRNLKAVTIMQHIPLATFESIGCAECRNLEGLGFDFTMAFQPIFNVITGAPFAYEALVRGVNGESAAFILGQVNDGNRYRFDQACRVRAIELATQLGLPGIPDCKLSINFLPKAVYRAETCIRATLEASRTFDFPVDRLMFEVTEGERVEDPNHLKSIFEEYARQGFTTAIDDFGSGYSGLNMLAMFQPQVLKIDMALTRDIDRDTVRQAIVEGIVLVSKRLGITVVAEGIETREEREALLDLGVELMQGYLFAKPMVGQLQPMPLDLIAGSGVVEVA